MHLHYPFFIGLLRVIASGFKLSETCSNCKVIRLSAIQEFWMYGHQQVRQINLSCAIEDLQQ